MIKNALNIAVLITLLNAMFILLVADDFVSPATFADNGASSMLNMALLLVAAGYCLWLALTKFADRHLDWLCLSFVFEIYLAREADLHRAFSDSSLTNWSTYLKPDVPVLLKLLSVLLLALLFMSLSYLLGRYFGVFLMHLKKARAWAVAAALWFFFLFSAQLIDRRFPETSTYYAIQEMFEVIAALFALLALIQFVEHYKNKYRDYFA